MTVSPHELKIIMNVVEGAAQFMELFEKHGPRKQSDCETYRRCADVISGVLQDDRLLPHVVKDFYPMVVRDLHRSVMAAQDIMKSPSANLTQIISNMKTGESVLLPDALVDELDVQIEQDPSQFPELQIAIKRMKNLV